MICFVFATEESSFGAEMSCSIVQVYHVNHTLKSFPNFISKRFYSIVLKMYMHML